MIFNSKSFQTIVFIFIVFFFFFHVSAAVSSDLPQVSSVYLGIVLKNDFPGWIISMPE